MSVSFRSSRKKRDFWEDENEHSSLFRFKKTRHIPPQHGFHLQGCSENKVGLLIAVHDRFPMLDEKTIAAVLEKYGDNLDAAIAKLEQLQLTPQATLKEEPETPLPEPQPNGAESSERGSSEIRLAPRWLDTILEELYSSANPTDSKKRLENVLRAFEEAAIENYKDNSEEIQAAKKQFEMMRKNNAILCKALTRKQERFRAQDEEMTRLREVLVQAEERIKSLELSNYSLTVHLERAIGPKMNDHGAPHPDVF